jgi:tetratricopeptide (TPR) repeat protein
MKTRYSRLTLAFLLLILVVPPVGADEHEDEWNQLNAKVIENYQAGKYGVATEIAIKQLAIAESHLPAELIATSLNNLAELYRVQAKYAEAEPLFKRSLAIKEKAFGPDHPQVALGLNNLALLYDNQGKYAEAEPLYKRALAIWEKALGSDHPSVATGLQSLALLYRTQGKYAEAEPLYKWVLAIREKALGPDHPCVTDGLSLNNLADLYRATDREAEAEKLEKRAAEDEAKG